MVGEEYSSQEKENRSVGTDRNYKVDYIALPHI